MGLYKRDGEAGWSGGNNLLRSVLLHKTHSASPSLPFSQIHSSGAALDASHHPRITLDKPQG